MEQQCFPSRWEFCHQQEGSEDDEGLKSALLYTSLELERTIITAKEEIARREYQLIHLKDQLSKATKERDWARAKCLVLMSEEKPESFSETCSQRPLVQSMSLPPFTMNKRLPEKGKLLRAVIEAGPLLQNLLLAGPLPQWEHPPPQLDLTDIPLVVLSPPLTRLDQDSCMNPTIDVCLNRKRQNLVSCEEESSDSTMNKHQKRAV